jgi:hypothetical protein
MSRRKCQARTKAGKPCKATPLKGSSTCLAHDEKAREKAGFGGAQEGAGRPANPRFTDLLRSEVQERAREVFAPLIDGLTATRWVVVGNGPSAHVEEVPDIPTRIGAAREIMDRVEGKPRQTSDVTARVDVHAKDQMNREIQRLLDELRRRNGHAASSPEDLVH